MHVDGQTDGQREKERDVTKLVVAFCSFANAPKILPHCYFLFHSYQMDYNVYESRPKCENVAAYSKKHDMTHRKSSECCDT